MHIEIEREVHEMTLETLRLGRLLAEEWLGGSLVPRGSSKSIIIEALHALQSGRRPKCWRSSRGSTAALGTLGAPREQCHPCSC